MKRIAIHGAPRSGTSWLGSIFDSSPNVVYRHQPLFSYAFKSYLDEYSNLETIDSFFSQVAATDDPFILQTDGKSKGAIPNFAKTCKEFLVYKEARYHNVIENLLGKCDHIKVIGIVRNPLSVLSSWKLAPKEFNPAWDFNLEWKTAPKKNLGRREEFYGFNKWMEVSQLFKQLSNNYPDRFYLLDYSLLLANTVEIVRQLFAFCGIPWNQQTLSFLECSTTRNHSEDPYSVFRINQRDDKWRDTLPEDIVRQIRQHLLESGLEKYID